MRLLGCAGPNSSTPSGTELVLPHDPPVVAHSGQAFPELRPIRVGVAHAAVLVGRDAERVQRRGGDAALRFEPRVDLRIAGHYRSSCTTPPMTSERLSARTVHAGAIKQRNLLGAEMAMRVALGLSLLDALDYLHLLAEVKPE